MHLRSTPFLAALALCLAVSTTSAQTTHTVTQTGFGFSPKTLTIAQGDTVDWIWSNGVHTVTSGSPCTASGLFNFPLDTGNPLATYTFTNPGTFDYFCIPHCAFGMVGTITVTATGVPAFPTWAVVTATLLALMTGVLLIRRTVKRAGA